MNAVIRHEIPGRMRVHFDRARFTMREADTLQYYLQESDAVQKAVVYERTADAVIYYSCERDEIISIIRRYAPEKTEVPESYYESSSRELNAGYHEKIVMSVVWHYTKKLLIPHSIRTLLTCLKTMK